MRFLPESGGVFKNIYIRCCRRVDGSTRLPQGPMLRLLPARAGRTNAEGGKGHGARAVQLGQAAFSFPEEFWRMTITL